MGRSPLAPGQCRIHRSRPVAVGEADLLRPGKGWHNNCGTSPCFMGKSTISMAILAILDYQKPCFFVKIHYFYGHFSYLQLPKGRLWVSRCFKPLSGACWLGLVERFDHAVITPNQDPLQIRLIARIIEVTGLSKQKMFLKTQTHNDPNIIK